MQDKMMKMLMGKKKEGKTLSPKDQKAKLEALKGMKGMAHQMMGDKLKNLKKVTVASDSKEGLKAGLHKAEDLADDSPMDDNGNPMGQDPNMYSGGSAYAEGGMVSLNNQPEDLTKSLEHEPGQTDYSGDEQGKMPQEFDTDMDHVSSEHQRDNEPRRFDEGGDVEHESLDEMVQEAPEDPDQLDKLIQMLEEKKQQLASK